MIIQTSGLIRDIMIMMQEISAIKMVNIFIYLAIVIVDKNAKFSSSDNLLQWTKIHTSINNNFNNGSSWAQGIEILNNLIL